MSLAGFLIRCAESASTNYHVAAFCDSASDRSSSSSSAGVCQMSAVLITVDARAPAPVKSNSCKTAPAHMTLVRRKRRTRRRSFSDNLDDFDFEGFRGDGVDGPFGGGSWGGGRGWNFDSFGGHSWDGSSSSSRYGPAIDFIFEVIYWISLSNCVHFAFKKVIRILANGTGDIVRGKVALRLNSGC